MSKSQDEAKNRKRPPSKTQGDQPPSAFEKFATLARRIVRVPKSEINKDDSTSD